MYLSLTLMTFVAIGKEDGIQVLYKDETIRATQFRQWCTYVYDSLPFVAISWIKSVWRTARLSIWQMKEARDISRRNSDCCRRVGKWQSWGYRLFHQREKTAPRKSGKDFRGAVYLSDSFSVSESVSEWFILQ